MKRAVVLIVMTLFLIGFITSAGITASAVENDEDKKNSKLAAGQGNLQDNELNKVQSKLTNTQIQKIIRTKNRVRINYTNKSGCPDNCSCTGSVTKCQLKEGREMTIRAGKSGNTIFQVKGINMSTKVELYKSEDKIYGVFKDNETREIKIFPDEIQERIRERIQTKLENQKIELDENGSYQVRAEKRIKLFSLFSIKATIRTEVDSETGEIIRVREPWWSFMARDEEENII